MNAARIPSAPTSPWLAHAAAIREVRPEVPGVATYELELIDRSVAEAYRFAPGQCNMLYLPGAGEVPISLSADPSAHGTWSHTVRVAGNVTSALARLGVGDCLGLRGPYGKGWPLEAIEGADVILAAGGIGLAPLRPAIYYLLAHRAHYGRLTLLYGARSPDTLLYADEFSEWSRRGLLVQTTVDRSVAGWLGNVGVVSLLLERLRLVRPNRCMLLTCGPEVMMRYTLLSARQKGIRAEQMWLSTERNMQCAVRMCGHCQLGPAFICQDGPVFRADHLAPYLSIEGL